MNKICLDCGDELGCSNFTVIYYHKGKCDYCNHYKKVVNAMVFNNPPIPKEPVVSRKIYSDYRYNDYRRKNNFYTANPRQY